MGQEEPLDRRGEPPSDVQITLLPDPNDRRLRERLAGWHGSRLWPRLLAAVVIGLAIWGLVATVPSADRIGAPRRADPAARARGPVGVAAAYGFPLRCLSVTISAIDPAFARADFDHASACGRYAGYPTAIFRRADGAWRPALEALGYRCPVGSVPMTVQRELGICP